jgi:hypothetical protein
MGRNILAQEQKMLCSGVELAYHRAQVAEGCAPVLPERALAQPLANLLAFSDGFVRALWRRAAALCGMPVEVAEGAQRGLDLPSLAGGVAALDAKQVQPQLSPWCTWIMTAGIAAEQS